MTGTRDDIALQAVSNLWDDALAGHGTPMRHGTTLTVADDPVT